MSTVLSEKITRILKSVVFLAHWVKNGSIVVISTQKIDPISRQSYFSLQEIKKQRGK